MTRVEHIGPHTMETVVYQIDGYFGMKFAAHRRHALLPADTGYGCTAEAALADHKCKSTCEHDWQPHDVYGDNCTKCGMWRFTDEELSEDAHGKG